MRIDYERPHRGDPNPGRLLDSGAVCLADGMGAGDVNKRGAVIRRNPDGTVDDVVISCTMFRLEQLDDDVFWAAAYRGKKRVMFTIRIVNGQLVAQDYNDDFGCIDDTRVSNDD